MSTSRITGHTIGSDLIQEDKEEVLYQYNQRFTGDNFPQWAKKVRENGAPYKVQFADDLDWLANTLFMTTKAGRLDKRSGCCISTPTWPEGKG